MTQIIDLTGLLASSGAIIQGDLAGDRAGWAVAGVGDFNGDGVDDFIVGAWASDPAGSNSGNAYLLFGKNGSYPSLDLSTFTAADGFRIFGDNAFDWAGWAVAGIGDIDNDGFNDVLLSSPLWDKAAPPFPVARGDVGASYVLFGKNSGFATIDLAALNPADGFAVVGDLGSDRSGWSVGGAGDVNNDGFNDYVIGARFGDNGGSSAGEAYVVFGKAGGFAQLDLSGFTAADGFIVQGDLAGDQAGMSVAGAGDVNGDGFDDVIVGAPLNDAGGTDAGAAYVIFGKGTAFGLTVDLTGLAASDGFVIRGDAAGDQAGWSVGGAGDVNGDGFGDVIVADKFAAGGGSEAGRAWVIFGKASGFGLIDLSTLVAANGFLLSGLGIAPTVADGTDFEVPTAIVSSAGDVNDDGYGDILIGAYHGDLGGADSGQAYLVYGKGSGFGTVDLTTLADSAGFVVQGDAAGDRVGASVAWAGDVNDDGFDDILVGGPLGDNGGGNAGEAYVIFGAATPFAYNYVYRGSEATPQTINGTSGADFFVGGSAGDTISGAARDDRLYGMGGDDTLTPGSGDDTVYGGSGIDTLSYADATGAVYASLAGHIAYETGVTVGTVTAASAVESTDTAHEIENLTGSAFGDRLYGDSGNNVIAPGAGADIVLGLGGADMLSYMWAAGAVFVDLDARAVTETALTTGTVSGATPAVNTDYVIGFADATGSAFGDRLYGTAAANALNGLAGDDILYGLDGGDSLWGLAGADRLIGGAGADTMSGGADADRFYWNAIDPGFTDTVSDFAAGVDDLYFLGSAFGYSVGATAILVSNADPVAAAANSFLYDTDTGLLSFDADGAGGGGPVAVAMLTGIPTITTADFVFY